MKLCHVNVKKVKHHSCFHSLERKMVHYKKHISLIDIITKRGQNGMVDYQNHFGHDAVEIVNKRGKIESYINF